MKKKTIFTLSIIIILYGTGSYLLYNKRGSNAAIVMNGIIVIIGVANLLRKKEE
jgi:hypothetical protein